MLYVLAFVPYNTQSLSLGTCIYSRLTHKITWHHFSYTHKKNNKIVQSYQHGFWHSSKFYQTDQTLRANHSVHSHLLDTINFFNFLPLLSRSRNYHLFSPSSILFQKKGSFCMSRITSLLDFWSLVLYIICSLPGDSRRKEAKGLYNCYFKKQNLPWSCSLILPQTNISSLLFPSSPDSSNLRLLLPYYLHYHWFFNTLQVNFDYNLILNLQLTCVTTVA